MEIFFAEDNAIERWLPTKPNLISSWKAFRELETASVIKMHGGEPFYKNKAQYYLNLIKNKNTKIIIETNGTRINNETIELLKSFNNLELHIKIDAIGNLQEYIRPGIDWPVVESNLKLLQLNNIKFIITPSLHIFNILNFGELENWCNKNFYHMLKTKVINTPVDIAPCNLPYQIHSLVPEQFKTLLTNRDPKIDAVNLINKLDKTWRSSIIAIIPAWKQVYDNLHWQQFNDLKKLNNEMEKYVG